MRKVLIFALVVAIALGGIGFAHAAVTESQDDLLIYPIAENGDSAVLQGLSASMTYTCGDHLRWNSTYSFGGGTETQFVYDREGISRESNRQENSLDFWLSGGASASTSGQFYLGNQGYGALFHAAAAQTENGSQKTVELKMSDYVDHYMLDFNLSFREDNRSCYMSLSFLDILENRDWYNHDGVYGSFLDLFRFPVQEDQTVSVSVFKNDAGQISSFDFYPNDGPELYFVSHVTGEGIWFVPIFRDFYGAPLSYESPEGHGVYFIPWKVLYTYETRVDVAPDLGKLQRVIALEEDQLIDHIEIDSKTNECRMLSREDGHYILSAWDLSTGTEKTRLEILSHDPSQASYGSFLEDGGYLLVTAQQQLALVDPVSWEVLLTAPDVTGVRYDAAAHNPPVGTLRYDGQRLYLLNPGTYYQDAAFWTAVWQEGELLYYGEYGCSLMRGNDSWYYSSVDVDIFPMQWK